MAEINGNPGLAPGLMMQDVVFLACCIPILLAVGVLGLKKQER
jgi:ribosome-dependent ATPase